MNARERVRAALTCQVPDRMPATLAFWEESLAEIAPVSPSDYFDLDVRFAQFKPPPEQDAFLSYLSRLPRDVHVGSIVQLRTYHEWNYHPELAGASVNPPGTLRDSALQSAPLQDRPLQDRPLQDKHAVDDLLGDILPRLVDPRRHAGLAQEIAAWHARGLAVAGSPPHLGGELFESAYRLRGFENFLMDLKLRQPLACYLLDQLTALALHSALILAGAGVDILLLDDDVAMPTGLILGPATWREFFKPRLADIIRQARGAAPDLLVFYHSDGNFARLVPDLVEIGVNVIHPVQPDCMDALAIKREFGDRLALWGTVGTASLWHYGHPDDIRREVRFRIDTLGPGGLLMAPAYDVDYAPFPNLRAFVDAVKEYGNLPTRPRQSRVRYG